MCGIIGYTGLKNANNIVVEGLKQLEYRGYDSFGIASLEKNSINVYKKTGSIGNFTSEQLPAKTTTVAIGHTRWATHGGITETNAHPHTAKDNRFALAHNGIVENYQQLRNKLIKEGHSFLSETDSEVIVRLIEQEHKTKPLLEAIRTTFTQITGRNAILVLDATGTLTAIRRGSPLIVGIGDNEYFISSDATSFISTTKKAVFLDDDEGVVIANKPLFFDATTGQEKTKQTENLQWDQVQTTKAGYPHFLIKEILEQKFTIRQAIMQDENKIKTIASMINNAFGTYAVGCGTAGKAALATTYFFSTIAHKHINFAFGSEFPNYHHFLKDKSLLLAISQSGETADTLEAIKTMKQKGGKVISIVNVLASTMVRISDAFLPVNCGPEIAVCSTKATTGQLALMLLLAHTCAGKHEEGQTLLKKTADSIADMLNEEFIGTIKKLAEVIKKWESIYLIARGVNYPIASEAAIKIQEVSYIHAEGFAGGELKHGPIALISKGTPCIVFVANDEVQQETLSNAMEIKSRGAYIIGIAPDNNEIFDVHIKVPDAGIASPLVNIIPIQLLAYYIAVAKGLDPDKPRNLAKSVTVM
ncbi:glutamine--fructose-6-phosphate transaminase (isomerizing) [Candidatus Woesearchaeota archaeon]|nr:glutamine--fructose-6-phosphate transaminase (isomerizing) [Candidatus Woesearchaeota archaeon]